MDDQILSPPAACRHWLRVRKAIGLIYHPVRLSCFSLFSSAILIWKLKPRGPQKQVMGPIGTLNNSNWKNLDDLFMFSQYRFGLEILKVLTALVIWLSRAHTKGLYRAGGPTNTSSIGAQRGLVRQCSSLSKPRGPTWASATKPTIN